MRYIRRLLFLFVFCFVANFTSIAQETLPIYSDYLSDNIYLLHPAAAGIGDTGKIRLTNRTQWKGVTNAPALQTLSFHNRFTDKAGFGAILFNDQNGNHSQTGLQGTYAYHLSISDYPTDFEQLSFGFSMSFVRNQFDRSIFDADNNDPVINALQASDSYFNGDFGMSYHKNRFFSYATIKNLFLTTKTSAQFKSLNLLKVLVSAGYFFGEEDGLQYEPSFMVLSEPYFQRTQVDLNMKVYKNFQRSKLWFTLSYRQAFQSGGLEDIKYITPIIGANYKQFMFSYTYTDQLGDLGIVPSGFHQFSLGIDVFPKRFKYRLAACPNIKSSFFR